MEIFDRYLMIANITGFVLYVVNMCLYAYTAKGKIRWPLITASVMGGSFGILLAILLFDRKTDKDNMMFRVFLSCAFVVQAVIILLAKGYHADNFTFAFWTFFAQHKILLLYSGIMNLISFAAFAVDKMQALKHKRRIREVTLLGLAFIGGSVGGFLAMYLFRHKTLKNYFTIGIPFMIVMQFAVIFYVMNAGFTERIFWEWQQLFISYQ